MSNSSAKRKYLIPLCVLLAALLVFVCIAVAKRLFAGKQPPAVATPATGSLEIFMLDVGQGEAVLAIYPDGYTLLIDCGPEASSRELVAAVKAQGVTRIDTLILSHSHSDHTGGLRYLLRNMPVGEALLAGHPESYSLVTPLLSKQHVPFRYVNEGDALPGSENVKAELFNPPANAGAAEENELSAVIRITCGRTSVLFAGDAGYEAESRMLALYARSRLRSNVLLVGHHGASTSSSLSFLKAVSPTVALISVGRDNEYGHPHAETLKRLQLVGAEVHTTAGEGTVHVRLDGNRVTVIK